MGLKEDLENDIAEAFNGDLNDAIKEFSYYEYVRGNYDPDLGTSGSFGDPVQSRGAFVDYTQFEIMNSNVEAADSKLIVLQNELSATPSIGSKIIETISTDEYRIQGREQDPTNTIWELHIRKVKN